MRLSTFVLVAAGVSCLACSGLMEETAEQATEAAIEGQGGGSVDIEAGKGQVEISSADGMLSAGGDTKMPDDLPVTLPGTGWLAQMVVKTPDGTMVTVKPPVGTTGLDAAFKAELAKLGCAEPVSMQMPGATSLQCPNTPGWKTLQVQIIGAAPDEAVTIVYQKADAAAGSADQGAPPQP